MMHLVIDFVRFEFVVAFGPYVTSGRDGRPLIHADITKHTRHL